MKPSIVIEGYAASGKSTLAARVAQVLDRTVVRPFNDENAAELIAYAGAGRFNDFDQRARAMLLEAERTAAQAPAVFDRHWLSVLAYLPDDYSWRWQDRPPTYVCWCDLDTTIDRLNARVAHQADRDRHAWFVARYRGLAETYGLPLIDTARLTPDEAADLVLASLRS